LQRLEPRLEFVLTKLRDEIALGNLLTLFDRKRDQYTGYLKGELNAA
jgi:hypothetical protein